LHLALASNGGKWDELTQRTLVYAEIIIIITTTTTTTTTSSSSSSSILII